MKKSTKRWIPVVIFWVVFVASIALADFWWIRTAWTVVLLLFVLAVSLYSVLHAGRDENGVAFQGGYPRWFMRFANDEEELEANRTDSK